MSITSIFECFSYIFNFKGNSLKIRIHSLKVVSSNPGGCILNSTPNAWVRIHVWPLDYNHVKVHFQWKMIVVSVASRGIRTHNIRLRRPVHYRLSRCDKSQTNWKDWTTVSLFGNLVSRKNGQAEIRKNLVLHVLWLVLHVLATPVSTLELWNPEVQKFSISEVW